MFMTTWKFVVEKEVEQISCIQTGNWFQKIANNGWRSQSKRKSDIMVGISTFLSTLFGDVDFIATWYNG